MLASFQCSPCSSSMQDVCSICAAHAGTASLKQLRTLTQCCAPGSPFPQSLVMLRLYTPRSSATHMVRRP
jgi:hypothetical protein